jgi:hypothetical protein
VSYYTGSFFGPTLLVAGALFGAGALAIAYREDSSDGAASRPVGEPPPNGRAHQHV